MKWYQKIYLGFLFFLLINLIVAFVVSCALKNMVIDGIMVEAITEKIMEQDFEKLVDENVEIHSSSHKVDDEQIRELLKSPEVQSLFNKYLEITIDSVTKEISLDEIEIERDVIKFLTEHRDELGKIVGQEITEEMINDAEKQMDGKDLSKSFQQTLNNTKRTLTENEILVVKGYKTIISSTFKMILMWLIFIDLFLVFLFQKSFSQWIYTIGKVLIVSGSFLLIMSIIVKGIVTSLSDMKYFQMSQFLIIGFIILLIGILIVVIYKLFKKRKEDLTKVVA